MKKKKYSLGTGRKGTSNSYLDSPAEVLAQNNINLAKAKEASANNDFANLLQSVGATIMSSAKPIAEAGMVDGGFLGGKELKFGGKAKSGVEEVEGEEVAETPAGDFLEFLGPKHEQGGIDVDLPEGTTVFSDSIKVDGKTMAERKKARNKKLSDIEKLLEKNPSDKALKTTYEKTLKNFTNEEEADLAVQEMIDMFFGNKDGKKALFGDGIFSNLGKKKPEDPKFNDFTIPSTDNASAGLGMSTDSAPVEDTVNTKNPKFKDFEVPVTDNASADVGVSTDADPLTPSYDVGKGTGPAPQGGTEQGQGAAASFIENLFSGEATAGDIVGLAGNLIGAFGPRRNTLDNRAGDTPNINAFEDFGKDALDANDMAIGEARSLKTNAERKIDLSRKNLVRRGRNSARGVSAMRALDMGAELQANRAKLDAQDQFARTMLGLLSERARLENQQDRFVMEGEQTRDINDRKDRDNFYTQLGKDISTMGTGIQETGRDLNAIEQRKIMKTLLDQLSKYGITLNDDYELSTKKEDKK